MHWIITRASVAAIYLGSVAPLLASDQSAQEREGQEVTARIRANRPTENSVAEGVFKIFQGRRKQAEIPFRSEVLVTATNWQARYLPQASTNAAPLDTLIIIHGGGNSNRYEWEPVSSSSLPSIARPLAGSDFLAGDLGLEFLLWPKQRVLKKELRSSQSCYVLESTNPSTNGLPYSRVVSWLDIDSVRDAGVPAIVYAEAFDFHNKRLKEFRPKDFKKVNGSWQLQEMEMENVQAGTKTRIAFKLDSN